jgi:hypothetical protein
MGNKIPFLTGFFGKVLLTGSKKDCRLGISDGVDPDDAVTKRQLDEVGNSITKMIAWDSGSTISTSVKEDEVTLITIPIPRSLFTVVGQSIEFNAYGHTENVIYLTQLFAKINGNVLTPDNDVGAMPDESQFHMYGSIKYIWQVDRYILELSGYIDYNSVTAGNVESFTSPINRMDVEAEVTTFVLTLCTTMGLGTGTIYLESFDVKFNDSTGTNLYEPS